MYLAAKKKTAVKPLASLSAGQSPQLVQRFLNVNDQLISSGNIINRSQRSPELSEALPQYPLSEQWEIEANLRRWALDDQQHNYDDWATAVTAAKPVVPIVDEDVEVVEVQQNLNDRLAANTTLSIPAKPSNLQVNKTLYFNKKGQLCNSDYEAYSKSRKNQLVNSLGLTHMYAGHGPDLTEHDLKSKCRTEGVSGKWATDFDAISAVAEAYRLIEGEQITPSSGFKTFDTVGIQSVNYRYRANQVFETQASKAKCGFKKHSDDYWLKTVFPYPEKVSNTGELLGYE